MPGPWRHGASVAAMLAKSGLPEKTYRDPRLVHITAGDTMLNESSMSRPSPATCRQGLFMFWRRSITAPFFGKKTPYLHTAGHGHAPAKREHTNKKKHTHTHSLSHTHSISLTHTQKNRTTTKPHHHHPHPFVTNKSSMNGNPAESRFGIRWPLRCRHTPVKRELTHMDNQQIPIIIHQSRSASQGITCRSNLYKESGWSPSVALLEGDF